MAVEWWIELFCSIAIFVVAIYMIVRNHRRNRKHKPNYNMPFYKDDYEYLQCLKDYLATCDWNLEATDEIPYDMYKDPSWLIGEIERVEQKIANENPFD